MTSSYLEKKKPSSPPSVLPRQVDSRVKAENQQTEAGDLSGADSACTELCKKEREREAAESQKKEPL